MPGYKTEDIRNIALVGHGGAGKTTLADRRPTRRHDPLVVGLIATDRHHPIP